MPEENNSDFGTFMQEQASKSDNPKSDNNNSKDSKKDSKKSALEIKKEEDKKELDEAKKESKANASKYASMQANLVQAQARRFIYLLPFIICGILLLLLIITRGGDWIQGITQFTLNKMRGN